MLPLPRREVELTVLIFVPEIRVSCLEAARPEYWELVALSHVLVQLRLEPPTVPLAATLVGVMSHSVRDIAGVVVAVATLPDTPFAVVTDTDVTVQLPPLPVEAAVIRPLPSTVMFAFVKEPTLEFTVARVEVLEAEGIDTSPVIAAREATTSPVVGEITSVQSLLLTESIAPVPESIAA